MSDTIPYPEIARKFLEKKINVATDRWDELKWGEHAHAFTVAHSNEAAVLDTIHGLLNQAIKDGIPFKDFRDGLLDMMSAKGWYGGNGHTKDDKRYINWRIGLIYDVNMRCAYEAEHYRNRLIGADLRPIWVYRHDPAVTNPRAEHLALDGKAFRYDDAFWNTYNPPNGWGCRCYVTTMSEHEAEKAGMSVEHSDDSGNPPDIAGVDWNTFDSTWKYNPAREALAPNFSTYKNLAKIKAEDGKSILSHVTESYRKSMDTTKLTKGEFNVLAKRINKRDYTPQHILYQVGNLEAERFEAMQDIGVQDCKIMASDKALCHGIGDKNAKQRIPESLFEALYDSLSTPDAIYENTEPKIQEDGREFHFVKNMDSGKILKTVLKQLGKDFSLRIKTTGYIVYDYNDPVYKKIW